MDEILKKIGELIDKTNYELYKAGLEDAKDITYPNIKNLPSTTMSLPSEIKYEKATRV